MIVVPVVAARVDQTRRRRHFAIGILLVDWDCNTGRRASRAAALPAVNQIAFKIAERYPSGAEQNEEGSERYGFINKQQRVGTA